VRVRYDEGVATRIGPEPCVGGREVDGEASAGEGAGQPSSPRKENSPGRRRCTHSGRQHERARQRERSASPAWSETLACADAPCAGTGRSLAHPGRASVAGSRREGEEP